MTPNSSERRVYSYFRFSTAEQGEGNSEARQLKLAKAFAAKRGLPFDDTLRMFDRGKSGFKGDNIKTGALGAFLAAIEMGQVARGSILVVENVDRITRLPFWEAFDVVSRIIRAGVTIYTTSPEMEYDESSDGGTIFALVGQIQLGHAESKKKSARVAEAMADRRATARKTGIPVTMMCPKWLEPINRVLDGKPEVEKFRAIPEAARAIQKIFELRAKGIGKPTICKKLNTEPYWTPPLRRKYGQPVRAGRWRVSYISKILRNRAVIGEFHPHRIVEGKRMADGPPMLDIYPAIVDRGVFDRVQQMVTRNNGRGEGGRSRGAHNLFRYIAVCGYCGSPMAYQPKGRPPKGRAFLICDAGRSGSGCGKSHAVRYDEFRDTILDNCSDLKPEYVLPDKSTQAKARADLAQQIQERVAQISALDSEIEKFEAMVGKVGIKAGLTYHERAQLKKDEKARGEKELTDFRAKLEALERDRRSLAKWTADLATLKKVSHGESPEAAEIRSTLHEHLRSFIEKIQVFAHGYSDNFIGPLQPTWPQWFPSLTARERRHLKGKKKAQRMTEVTEKWRAYVRKSVRTTTVAQDIEDYFDAIVGEAQPQVSTRKYGAFMRYAMGEMKSKRARFFRVHFRSGVVRDFVPTKSIAWGWALNTASPDPDSGSQRRDGKYIYPPVGVLWREFEAQSDVK